MLFLMAASITGSVSAQTETIPVVQSGTGDFDKALLNANTVLLYPEMDALLQTIVVNTGPSHRYKRKPPPHYGRPLTGTRIRHVTFRKSWLEANRVDLTRLDEDHVVAIRVLADELTEFVNTHDLTRLSRDEQLAFWFNLHNILVLAELAESFPTRYGRHFMEGAFGRPGLHNKKILALHGEMISLRELRQNIVYALWDDPLVIYGFFWGAVGGPNIRTRAYTGETVWQRLERNAQEFVNSLRGVDLDSGQLIVSKVYTDAEVLFPDFENDVFRHIAAYANNKTFELLQQAEEFGRPFFDYNLADPQYGFYAAYDHIIGYTRHLLIKFEQFGWPGTIIEIEEVPSGTEDISKEE